MSTRCEIGIELPEGGVHTIYNHYDGYLDGVGLDLITNWNSFEKAEKATHGEYNNEKWQWDWNSIDEWIKHLKKSDREYAYLWRNDHWEYIGISTVWDSESFQNVWDTEWKNLQEGLIKLQKEIDEGL